MILVHAELQLNCIMHGLSPSIQFESFFSFSFLQMSSLLRGFFSVHPMLTMCPLFQLLLLNYIVTDWHGNVI